MLLYSEEGSELGVDAVCFPANTSPPPPHPKGFIAVRMNRAWLLWFHVVSILLPSQSKRFYEQRCREADEAEQTAEKSGNAPTATPKQIEKVNHSFPRPNIQVCV